MLKTLVVGIGKQATEDHLPAIQDSSMFELTAVCDLNPERVQEVSQQYNVPGYTQLGEALTNHTYDVVIVAVPHHMYLTVLSEIIPHGIHVIKEKPFATSMKEALALHELIQKHNVYVGVTLQRRFHPVYRSFEQLKRRIGKIYLIEGRYTFNIERLDQGWRASKEASGGGALIDMGYHFIDLFLWFFGMPETVSARMSRGNRDGQVYDVEDTAALLMDLPSHNKVYDEKAVAQIIISRVYPKKGELLRVHGTKGFIVVERGLIQRFDQEGNVCEELERRGAWPSAAIDQLEHFAHEIEHFKETGKHTYLHQLRHVAVIEAAYKADREETSISPGKILEEYGINNLL